MLKSIEGNFDNPEVNDLLTNHFIELRAASPEGSAHVLDIPGLKVSSIKFWSLWSDKKLIGCGALKFLDKEHGEFKSIRVHNNYRNTHKLNDKEFFFDYLKKEIKEKRKMGHITILV